MKKMLCRSWMAGLVLSGLLAASVHAQAPGGTNPPPRRQGAAGAAGQQQAVRNGQLAMTIQMLKAETSRDRALARIAAKDKAGYEKVLKAQAELDAQYAELARKNEIDLPDTEELRKAKTLAFLEKNKAAIDKMLETDKKDSAAAMREFNQLAAKEKVNVMPRGMMGGFGGMMGGMGGMGGGSAMGGSMGGGRQNQPPAVDMKSLPEKADNSGWPMVSSMKPQDGYPEALKFRDGRKVEKPSDWAARAKEISDMYQYYVYGVWRDGSDEKTTYEYDAEKKSLAITITRKSTGKSGTMRVGVTLPDAEKVKMPQGGWPVVVGMHGGIQERVAASRGYAAITLNTGSIAGDNNRHTGIFYDLYPYGDDWKEQTGVLMAWSWGAAKVLDALEAGAGKELKINPKNSIITGVSRYGKAAMVCGAFEKRFKMAAPSCSGAGGVAMFRYVSEGKTYDFTTKNASASYKYSKNEPISSLQATGEQGWFNNKFMAFNDPKTMPFDQHMLCLLTADPNRYLFIIGSCVSEDWVNAPAMWLSYRAAKPVFEFLGLEDHIVANIHTQGHAVIAEDMNYMIDYFNQHVYGIQPERDLSNLTTSVFELPVNKDPLFDSFGGKKPGQPKPDPAPEKK